MIYIVTQAVWFYIMSYTTWTGGWDAGNDPNYDCQHAPGLYVPCPGNLDES